MSSIKWLITRIYQDQGIPDKLSELFYRDEESNLKLCDAVSSVLTNGSLYSQAASKILRDPGLIVVSFFCFKLFSEVEKFYTWSC